MAELVTQLVTDLSGLYLIKDSLVLPGRFVAVQLLFQLLKQQSRVVWVCANQSFESLKGPLKRAGFNPSTITQSGVLTPLHIPQGSASRQGEVLAELFHSIDSAVTTASSSAEATDTAVIIDDITVLAALSASPLDWCHFLTAVQSLSQQVQGYRLMVVAHEDVEEDRKWMNQLEHRAEVVLHMEPIPGGMADIHGQVTIAVRGATSALQVLQQQGTLALSHPHFHAISKLFFKAGDLSLTWIPQPTVHGT